MLSNSNQKMDKSKLKNKEFSIISRDCIGGILYHQLGEKFLSPTINLFFTIEDFNYFCRYLNKYISTELIELKDKKVDYPVGILKPKTLFKKLKPIRVDFMHYETFENAKQKWDERKKRINYKNIFVVNSCCYSTELDTLSNNDIKDWKKIKFPKVILVEKSFGFKNEFIVKKPENTVDFAWLLALKDKENDLRVFNDFDFISFLNKKI